MKKSLLSAGVLIFATAMVAGATGATRYAEGWSWTSWNSWNSRDNSVSSGTVDLTVGNESYMTDDNGLLRYSLRTSWQPASSLHTKRFFDFDDLKPGDLGEDAISLRTHENAAWACMSIRLTGAPEHGINEPETFVDSTLGAQGGELAHHLFFRFWADDGDAVYETGEKVVKRGSAEELFTGALWKLADSSGSIWGGSSPLVPGEARYVGAAWCVGEFSELPVPQDGEGRLARRQNGPLARGTGFACDGTETGNTVQSDGLLFRVGFTATQARNNAFLCSEGASGGGMPPARPPRDEREEREERDTERDERPARDDRPERDERPSRDERSNR